MTCALAPGNVLFVSKTEQNIREHEMRGDMTIALANQATALGEFELVASHNTLKGFAIGVARTRSGRYAVARMAGGRVCLVLGYRSTEQAARTLANAEWSKDMGRTSGENVMVGAAPRW